MKNASKLAMIAFIFASGLAITSCSSDDDSPTPQPQTLYQKLGGTTMVSDPNNSGQMIEQGRLSYRSVIDSTVMLIVADVVMGADGNLAEYFAPVLAEVGAGNTTGLSLLSKNLTDFFSANTGGGATNTYTGMNMVDAHNPATNPRMGKVADDGDHTKFIGYVGESAGLNGVTDPIIINEVVAVLESLRDPIVQE